MGSMTSTGVGEYMFPIMVFVPWLQYLKKIVLTFDKTLDSGLYCFYVEQDVKYSINLPIIARIPSTRVRTLHHWMNSISHVPVRSTRMMWVRKLIRMMLMVGLRIMLKR